MHTQASPDCCGLHDLILCLPVTGELAGQSVRDVPGMGPEDEQGAGSLPAGACRAVLTQSSPDETGTQHKGNQQKNRRCLKETRRCLFWSEAHTVVLNYSASPIWGDRPHVSGCAKLLTCCMSGTCLTADRSITCMLQHVELKSWVI